MQWLQTLQIHDFHGTAQWMRDAETAKSTSQESSQMERQDTSSTNQTCAGNSGGTTVKEDDRQFMELSENVEKTNLEEGRVSLLNYQ